MISIPLCADPEDNTWDTVDGKLAEAEFFLRQMASVAVGTFEFGCYLSAYLSSARTATFAFQRFTHIPGFAAWYEPHQARLKTNSLARFMLAVRNDHLHGGPYPIAAITVEDDPTASRARALRRFRLQSRGEGMGDRPGWL
jgi:hypothetical protein